MNKKVASELMNWKEVGFRRPVIIYENVSECELEQRRIDHAGLNFWCHESLVGGRENFGGKVSHLKNRIRDENSTKGKTPRFKWKDTAEEKL